MSKDMFTREWITENSLEIIDMYEPGILTLRALHYQLVGRGMTNSIRHYKRVVSAMGKARWDGEVPFETFSDHDREVLGETYADDTILEDEIERAKESIELWMTSYYGNRWENQEFCPEVWIEKKALQGVFQKVCENKRVALAPCKGYPSLTFLYDAANRFEDKRRRGFTPIILYFGDYDPSGEDIPRSIQENIESMTGYVVEVRRFALMEDQVRSMGLPHAPTKMGDSRSANWDGIGQVELDAIEPTKLMSMCAEAIDSVFDYEKWKELEDRISDEKPRYVQALKDHVSEL